MSQRVVAVLCTGANVGFALVCAYAAPVLDDLRQCLAIAGESPVVIAGDSNARHAVRGSDECAGGAHASSGDPAPAATYSNAYTESWIDVTLATPSMVLAGLRWRVAESEHRHIKVVFGVGGGPPEPDVSGDGACLDGGRTHQVF